MNAPSESKRDKVLREAQKDLASFTYVDSCSGQIEPLCCCVCDAIPKAPHSMTMAPVTDFVQRARWCALERRNVSSIYPDAVLNCYKVEDPRLTPFVLSPYTVLDSSKSCISVCNECWQYMLQCKKRKGRNHPPPTLGARLSMIMFLLRL